MSEPVTPLPAPELPPPPPPRKWEREHRAFLRLLPDLLKTHRGLYVAIHDEQVIDSDADKIVLIERALRRVGNVDIHVGLVSEQAPPPVRIPHRREVHPGA